MPLDKDSEKCLLSVKDSGKPCHFVLVKKNSDVTALVASRKGTVDSRKGEARKVVSGGELSWGVIEGKGANLSFKLLKADGFNDTPVKDSKLRSFLEESHKSFKGSKAKLEVVDAVPDVTDDDQQQQPQRPVTQTPQQPTTTTTQTTTTQTTTTQSPLGQLRSAGDWKTIIAAIQSEAHAPTKVQLLSQAKTDCQTEMAIVQQALLTDPNSDDAKAKSVALGKVQGILDKLMPQMPQAPLTPPQKRRKDRVDLVDSKREELSQAIHSVRAAHNKPFGDTDIGPLTAAAKQAAEETRVGVHKDKTLISIADELAAANDLALRGELHLAHAKLVALQQQLAAGKAVEEKERKGAILGPTKHIHNARIAEYDKLQPVIDAAAAKIGAAISEATHVGNDLCNSVKTMLEEYKKGTVDALNPPLVAQLEALLARPGVSNTIAAVGQKLLLAAKSVLSVEFKKREGTPKTPTDKAQLLLDWGICSGSKDRGGSEKGNSDSFFLKGPDGKLQYVLKPMQGESVTTPDWVQGGGPVREVLSSKLNDLIKGQTGDFDCRGLPTEFVSLEDPSLARGGISQETKRTGSLQKSAPEGSQTVEQMVEKLGTVTPDQMRAFKAKFNEDDCQAIALRQFLTFDQDAHGGNMMTYSEGDGPGQTRLIPIDAGQSLPSPTAAKRNAAALRIGGKYNADALSPKNLLLPQLPSATKPFSGKALQAIQALDPDKLANDLKAENDKLVQQDPSVGGKVDPGAFDLIRKSAKFLKLAATAGLTLREISMVYGEGFYDAISADSQAEDKALQAALDTALYLKSQPKGFDGLDEQFQALGFSNEIRELRLDQKEKILKNGWTKAQWDQQYEADMRAKELADIADFFDATAPEFGELPALIKSGFQGKDLAYLQMLDYHRRKGGDPLIKSALAGNDATLALELKKPLKTKSGGGWDIWKAILDFYTDVGGNNKKLLDAIGPKGAGLPLDKQVENFRKLAPYDGDGGDKALRELGQKWLTLLTTSLTQDPTGEALDKQIGAPRPRKILPKTQTELDTLLTELVATKADALASLKAMEKKKLI